MAKTSQVVQSRGYKLSALNINNASGTTTQDLFTAGTDDSVIKSISVTSTNTTAVVLEFILRHDGDPTEYLFYALSIPANAGTNGTVIPVDGLSSAMLPLDRVQKKVMPLQGLSVLAVRAQTAVASGKNICVTVLSEEY